MRMFKKGMALALTVMMLGGLVGCASEEKADTSDSKTEETSGESGDDKIVIGMTLYSLKNEFTVRLANAATAKAEELGVELKIYDGNYDPSTQISQIETMISDGVDGIVLNPQDAEALAVGVDKAVAAGIPVVGVNTRVKSDKLTSYVGSQDVYAGELETQYIVDLIGDTFNCVIIEGPLGQSAQIERREGIQNILDKNTGIKVLAEKTANWSRSESMTIMENWLNAFDNVDAVIAENDEMALGAREAIKAKGLDIPVIGVDGITDALNAVESGDMVASIFQDGAGQGSKAVEVLINAINGETVDKEYWIDFEPVTKDNVAEFKKRAQ
ncbi:substrate-binding domain-containing protein [Anaerobium acetethylicum]|uniref:Putative xylitol transport system substrate-binding protein/inositol transport system substrate-binding protein n=1 Tax=Anaerobium acetethylicum TaxID=1619234 RepID=A0A1D3TTT7_9FIRM|nr:substrate-binding domain-containing protein [Anaerobium acetethylicum]SCP97423.1 putative xylitol transport system substrate-binding protein/inositol transport system substrate-binding protein [Anaerobium acetethylicum]